MTGGRGGAEDVRVVTPLGRPLDAEVTLPGSKSITNRALVVAALAQGTSVLEGALAADDTAAMVTCLRALGIDIESSAPPTAAESTSTLTVRGAAGPPPASSAVLDARQAGTVGRFLPAVMALGTGTFSLDADAQLRRRPFGPLLGALRNLGIDVESAAGDHLPLTVRSTGPGAWGDSVALRGDVSSQFVSALMLVAPLLPAGLRIALTTPLVSRPYLGITAGVMAAFGAGATVSEQEVAVPPGGYGARRYRIEPDASAASYLLAAPLLCGGRVRVIGLGAPSLQGDARFVDVLARMGAVVNAGPDHLEVARPPGTAIHGIDVDMAAMSDLVPTLAVVAAFADSPTRIEGVGFIRAKESDRIGGLVRELRRLGVDADEEPDGLVVRPHPAAPRGGRVRTYDDHRMAMSFAVVGLATPGVEITDPGCVAKSFPTFWSVLDRLGRG